MTCFVYEPLKKDEGSQIQYQPDLNEIELDYDSEQSESNGIIKSRFQSDSNEIDLES